MAGLRLENVSKTFHSRKGDVLAVRNVDLEVADGGCCVILGPSGCGKSTLLRLIAGLETLSAGIIRIGDRDVSTGPPKDRNVALVPQGYALYPHLSVFENLAFGLRMRRTPQGDIARQVQDTVKRLGIDSHLDRRPGTLSGGEQQRVALGRAIVQKPQVFLFDEPLASLDQPLRLAMRTELKRLQRELNITTIHVTHNQEEAMALADRLVVLRDGAIQQVGAPRDVYDRPANRFVASFVGNPPMRFLQGVLQRQDGKFRIEVAQTQIPIHRANHAEFFEQVGCRIDAGLRAEDVKFVPGNDPCAPASDEVSIPATVEVVESLGYSHLVTVRTEAGESLTARAVAIEGITVGTRGRAVVSVRHVHLFANSGPRLN